MKKMLSLIWAKLPTKYWIAVSVFVLWVSLFTENSLLQHFQNKRKLFSLTEQESYLRSKIISDKRKIEELQTNLTNLEKFAREEFLMKKEKEDVFLIVEGE
ncbi:FtsB family cell division protein [Sunxiuqinia sp. sy24]|uniref:FtsB family cell division protein n=1 Tax=Sunxiuqinia sp. sy24 TaxID=3461495 RepID=UPI004045A10E